MLTIGERKKELEDALNELKIILKYIGVNIDLERYDGMILKFLGVSNTYPEGKTYHIAISGEQRDLFPYLRPIRYLDDEDYDKEFKSYYVLKVPIMLSKCNCLYLKNNKKLFEDDDVKISSFATVLRSRRADGSEQIEFSSQKRLDDNKLRNFRKLLPKNSFLIILKLKNEVRYELLGFPGIVNLKKLDDLKFDLDDLQEKIPLLLSGQLDFDEFKNEFKDKIYEKFNDYNLFYKEFKSLKDSNSDLNELEEKIRLVLNEELDYNEFKNEFKDDFKDELNKRCNWNELEFSDLEELKYGIDLYKFKDNLYYYYNKRQPNTKTLISFKAFNINQCTNGENILLYGVPGSGKSWTIEKQYCDDESRMERVVFHPDYTYSDFIGQILPKLDDNNKVVYDFIPGPFTSILRKAKDNPTKDYYLIIEEINRGNAPAIFGDVFQLLDRFTEDKEYRKGTSKYAITNPEIANVVYENREKKVRIPSNLSIIATMNTSDQNVFTLDTAFQRRWNMRLIENTFDNADEDFYMTPISDTDISWRTFCEKVNDLILEKNSLYNSSEDKRLGVYFVSIDDLKCSEHEGNITYCKFSEKVLKYLWDDAFKFNHDYIFKKEFKSLEDVIHEFNTKSNNERFNIFNNDFIEELGIDTTTFKLKGKNE